MTWQCKPAVPQLQHECVQDAHDTAAAAAQSASPSSTTYQMIPIGPPSNPVNCKQKPHAMGGVASKHCSCCSSGSGAEATPPRSSTERRFPRSCSQTCLIVSSVTCRIKHCKQPLPLLQHTCMKDAHDTAADGSEGCNMYPMMHDTRTLFGRAYTPSSISAAQWWAIHTPRQLRSCSVVNRDVGPHKAVQASSAAVAARARVGRT